MNTNSIKNACCEQEYLHKRILLVDDDNDILESLKAVINLETDYIVETASNSFDVKRILKQYKPDIALLDIKLENESGFELIPAIKQENPEVICIMMTAYRDVTYAVNAVKSGVDDYLFKPLDTEELLSTLDKSLNNQDKNKKTNEATQRIKTIFELTSELFFLLDRQGVLHEITQTALDFAGVNRKDTINQVFWESPWWKNHPEFREPMRMAIDKALSGRLTNLEIEITGIDNKPTHLDLSLKPILDEQAEVSFILIEGHDITSRKHIETRLNRLAHYDALTGLPNRFLFDEQLTNAIARYDRHKIRFALMYIDLDNFKEVNDGLGHHAGDQLLLNISTNLMKCMRELDAVSRIGGDEFVAIITDISDYQSVAPIADRIIHSIVGSRPVEGQTIPISASGGVAVYPDDGVTAHKLLRHADQAMYAAKKEGKNCWMSYKDLPEK